MNTFLRTVEFLSLSLWLGSDVFLSFVVAPGAFQVLATRDQAGLLVGFALTRMHIGGIICGVIFLVARLARTRVIEAVWTPAALCVLLMIAATLVSQFTVSAKMAGLRRQMGSIQATAADAGERGSDRWDWSYVFDGPGNFARGLVRIFLLLI